jgi:DNA repair exonuclease SbcCD ATPase subunit
VYSLTLNKSVLNQKVEEISQSKQLLLDNSNKLQEEKKPLLEQQLALKAKLNEPQLLYQQNLKLIEGWEGKLNELTGTPEIPETLKGIEKRISQLDDLPASLKEKINLRKDLTGEIFDILDEQRRAREKLFKPVQDLIQNNDLIREEFKLQFQATLGAAVVSMISTLFALIKNATGDFRGEDESRTLVIKLFEKYDHSIKSDLLSLIEELNIKIHEAAGGSDIEAMLRKDKKARDVYDLLYGLSYIEPRYSLLFQETQIEQLSPGQRGALLLIFYLLVDKGRNPIILDQPEENLDNETVFNLLVPVLSQAKKRRQVIMVTHNPNLAVVCDAEQIIYSSFNRKNSSRIEYISGSIENPVINQCVVNVLEGTKPAFNNRKGKYHPDKLP